MVYKFAACRVDNGYSLLLIPKYPGGTLASRTFGDLVCLIISAEGATTWIFYLVLMQL